MYDSSWVMLKRFDGFTAWEMRLRGALLFSCTLFCFGATDVFSNYLELYLMDFVI